MRAFVVWGLCAAVVLAGCKSRSERAANEPLRLAYFPNITHGQALVGQAEGTFARYQPDGRVELRQFNAGPAAMEALLSGSLDAAYVGTGPAITAYLKAGKTLRVIAGATSGGAVLVTREKWTPQQLKGKHLATPQLGNTQDVALRHWLQQHGLKAATGGTKGDVTVTPISNSDILSLYQRGEIDGAWVPEPWGARLLESGGVLLLDERELWPNGEFPTTLLVTTTEALKTKPRQLEGLLRAHIQLTEQWRSQPESFAQKANAVFGKITGKPLKDSVLEASFSRMGPALEPPVEALARTARHAKEVGFLSSDEVSGMVEHSLLQRWEAVSAPPAARRTPPMR